MSPINPLDSMYLFDHGRVKLRYISKHPYPYAGSHELDRARTHLKLSLKRRHSCNVDWFRVPMEWVFNCPKYTIGYSYSWEDGELTVDSSPKNTEASGRVSSEPLTFSTEPGVCAHPGVEAGQVHSADHAREQCH